MSQPGSVQATRIISPTGEIGLVGEVRIQETRAPVLALHPQAVIDAPVGVTRACLGTPWRWHPRRLGEILIFATLRG